MHRELSVDSDTQRRLLEINRAFYERFARHFADARSAGQASLQRAVRGVTDGQSVLDVGCGDGRAARALDELGRRVTYHGLDASSAIIELARTRCATLERASARFAVADIVQPGWRSALLQPYHDVVLCLAVLHHIPGSETRQRVLIDLAGALAPSGRLILSAWQFPSSERLRRRIVPWQAAGIDERTLEPGDYLLDWRRGGYGLRYCSLIGESDLRALCAQAGLAIDDMYTADGGLNLFVVARRA